MSRMPGATWRPVVNVHKNGVKERRGLVLHVQAGSNSPYGWFNNPSSQASSDFWVSKTGVIEQYAETGTDYAWAQAAGNPYYASVETEGQPSEPLTAAQIEGVAKIYAWGHKTFGWPLMVVDSTTAHGLTYHGAGGAAWGGHTGCPGDLRKAQRPQIIARATALANGTTTTTTTTKEADVAFTADDIEKFWGYKNPKASPAEKDMHQQLLNAASQSTAAAAGIKALTTQVAALQATVATLAGKIGTNVDTAAVVAAVDKAIAAAVVDVHVDVTGQDAGATGASA